MVPPPYCPQEGLPGHRPSTRPHEYRHQPCPGPQHLFHSNRSLSDVILARSRPPSGPLRRRVLPLAHRQWLPDLCSLSRCTTSTHVGPPLTLQRRSTVDLPPVRSTPVPLGLGHPRVGSGTRCAPRDGRFSQGVDGPVSDGLVGRNEEGTLYSGAGIPSLKYLGEEAAGVRDLRCVPAPVDAFLYRTTLLLKNPPGRARHLDTPG